MPIPSRKRAWKAIAVSSALVLLMCAVFTSYLLFPKSNPPEHADVVVVVAGASDGRHELGARLVKELGITNFVVSNPNGSSDKKGYSHCAGSDKPKNTLTWCLDPYPLTTAGEALTFNELAKQQGWNSAIIVTNKPHAPRVQHIFNNCTGTENSVTSIESIDYKRLSYHVLREAAGFVKHWVTAPCSN